MSNTCVVSYTDVCVINVAAEMFIASAVANGGGGAGGGGGGGDLGPGVLFVQDVIMAGSVEEEDAGVTVFGEDVVIDCPTLASVHVLHQDGDV